MDRCFSESLREDDFMNFFFFACVCGNVIQHVIWESEASVLGSKVTAASTWARNVLEMSLQLRPSTAELSAGEAVVGLGWPLPAYSRLWVSDMARVEQSRSPELALWILRVGGLALCGKGWPWSGDRARPV